MSERELAPGAPPRAGEVPLAVPHLAGNEWAYVQEALDTNWVSSVGPFVDRFESALAEAVGAAHAVAVVNGTAALHLALLLAGVEPDDEVLVPTLTFIAPANAVRYVGAHPVFVDCEPEHWQLDVAKVAAFLDEECEPRGPGLVDRRTGRRVRALLPVHVLGHPVDLDPLLELARRYGLALVEDAAESLGARYRGRSPGTFGVAGALSFNGNKVITTGGGGALVTDDGDLAQRARYLTTQAKDDPLEYVHGAVGFNYRLSNVLAAIGSAQLEQLEERVEAKRRIARRYADAFAGVDGLAPMREAPWAHSAFWLSTVLVDPAGCGIDSRGLLRRLGERGIQSRPLWQPLHRSKPYARCRAYRCEVAERVHAQALSLPSTPSLGDADQERVIEAVLRETRR